MLARLQQTTRQKPVGLWLLALVLLFVQILPLHFHNHADGQEPSMAHHHNLMTYLNDGGDDIADSQLQTVDLDLYGLSDAGDVDMPVLLFTLVLLLTLVACYRCRGIRTSESPQSYPSGSYRLPPLRAPPIH